MLDKSRLRNKALFAKVTDADTAARLIQDHDHVGFSGFTPSGYPKKTALALAEQIKAGRKCRISIWTGASVGPEIEEALAEVHGWKAGPLLRSKQQKHESGNQYG